MSSEAERWTWRQTTNEIQRHPVLIAFKIKLTKVCKRTGTGPNFCTSVMEYWEEHAVDSEMS